MRQERKRSFLSWSDEMERVKRLTDEQATGLLPLVRGKVRKFVGDQRRDAELRDDLVQDAFVRILKRLPLYEPDRGSLGDFAATVVDSVLLDHLRHDHAKKRDRRRAGTSLNAPLHGSAEGPTELGATISAEARDASFGRRRRQEQDAVDLLLDVSEMLRQMKPDHRRLCEQLKSVTVAEAAAEEGIARGTGYRRLRSIQRRHQNDGLRKYLD
jgi:RNA polymerase sigma-70 factor (ECF subfamily)